MNTQWRFMGKTGKHLYPNTLNLFGYIQEYLKSQLKLSQIVPPFADFSGNGRVGEEAVVTGKWDCTLWGNVLFVQPQQFS